ncbi:uncharacterized protein [Watersipora subatra]|uniref:uncharacterized protein n=1 Tax=Watersipora subatra TaxID=2589382 RepID=UPI00355C8B16
MEMTRGNRLRYLLLLCVATCSTAYIYDEETTPAPLTRSSSDENEMLFIPAERPALTQHLCCLSAPYNVTDRVSFVATREVPVVKRRRVPYINRCPLFPNAAGCQIYRWEQYFDYQMVTRVEYRTVVREIYCKEGDEVCCQGYTRTNSFNGCMSTEDQYRADYLSDWADYAFRRFNLG